MEGAEIIQWCLEHLNYWTVMLLMAIESSFIPLPSEVVVPPAAYKAASVSSDMNVFLLVFFATVGAVIGALFNYGIAYFLGIPVINKFVNSRWGRMCLLDDKKVTQAQDFFNGHGAVATFVGRLIPAVRQLISIPAGLAKMPMAKFLLYTFLGAAIWNSILAAIGYYLQSVVPEEQLMEKVYEYSDELKWIIIGGVLLVIAFLLYKGRQPKQK